MQESHAFGLTVSQHLPKRVNNRESTLVEWCSKGAVVKVNIVKRCSLTVEKRDEQRCNANPIKAAPLSSAGVNQFRLGRSGTLCSSDAAVDESSAGS
jgi:hypothetical protein